MIISKSFDGIQHKSRPNVSTNWILHDNHKSEKTIRNRVAVCQYIKVNVSVVVVVCVQRNSMDFNLTHLKQMQTRAITFHFFYCFIFFCSLFAMTESCSCASHFFSSTTFHRNIPTKCMRRALNILHVRIWLIRLHFVRKCGIAQKRDIVWQTHCTSHHISFCGCTGHILHGVSRIKWVKIGPSQTSWIRH